MSVLEDISSAFLGKAVTVERVDTRKLVYRGNPRCTRVYADKGSYYLTISHGKRETVYRMVKGQYHVTAVTVTKPGHGGARYVIRDNTDVQIV